MSYRHGTEIRGGADDREAARSALRGGFCAECTTPPQDRRLCHECARCLGRPEACGHADWCSQAGASAP